MQDSTAYIGLDVHSRTCTVAWMNEEGTCRGPSTFRTSGENLRREISAVEADEKVLTLEEGPLSFWTARVLDSLVDRTVVCDPRENYLISRSARKDDEADAKSLARLLRLGEVKEVYQPENDRRALFNTTVAVSWYHGRHPRIFAGNDISGPDADDGVAIETSGSQKPHAGLFSRATSPSGAALRAQLAE